MYIIMIKKNMRYFDYLKNENKLVTAKNCIKLIMVALK